MTTPTAADRRRNRRALRPFWSLERWSGRAGIRRRRTVRRTAALLLLLAAGWSAAQVPTPGGQLLVAVTRDLGIGATLTGDDVTLVPSSGAPDGAQTMLDTVIGRRVAHPVRRGEVLTDVRLVGVDGPQPGPGRVALTVRPADPAMSGLLQPGSMVSVVGLSDTAGATTLTSSGLVLAVLAAEDRGPGGTAVLLSVPAADADAVSVGTLAGDIALRVT